MAKKTVSKWNLEYIELIFLQKFNLDIVEFIDK